MSKKTWSEKVSDLKASGMTYAQIAAATGSKVSTIGSLAKNVDQQPRGNLALRLQALHKKSVKK